jgi:hypothetical protein
MPLRNVVVTDRLATVQTAEARVPEASGLLSLQSASGVCSCQKPGCFSFNTTYEPHVVILCDFKDWSVASVCPWYLWFCPWYLWSILVSCVRESVSFIGTQFSIIYTSMYSPAEAATPRA